MLKFFSLYEAELCYAVSQNIINGNKGFEIIEALSYIGCKIANHTTDELKFKKILIISDAEFDGKYYTNQIKYDFDRVIEISSCKIKENSSKKKWNYLKVKEDDIYVSLEKYRRKINIHTRNVKYLKISKFIPKKIKRKLLIVDHSDLIQSINPIKIVNEFTNINLGCAELKFSELCIMALSGISYDNSSYGSSESVLLENENKKKKLLDELRQIQV